METTRYQIQVTGEWGGSVGSWRPSITGTLNQTGHSDEWASSELLRPHDEWRETGKDITGCDV